MDINTNIFLVGYMYSGKSTIGKQLAKKLGIAFIDTDLLFEQSYHTSIPLFFKRYGETAFRKLERMILEHSIDENQPHVISTGGGTACHNNNMDWINAHGISVYLEMSAAAICARAKVSKKPRPLLEGLTETERLQYITRQLETRLPFYQKAHYTIPGLNPDVESLVNLLFPSSTI